MDPRTFVWQLMRSSGSAFIFRRSPRSKFVASLAAPASRALTWMRHLVQTPSPPQEEATGSPFAKRTSISVPSEASSSPCLIARSGFLNTIFGDTDFLTYPSDIEHRPSAYRIAPQEAMVGPESFASLFSQV